MKMKIKAINIKYDTDGKAIPLPKELILRVDDDFDPDQELADKISDETGFCVFSCDYEVIPEPELAEPAKLVAAE
jgi:hypothetical protein